MDPDELREYRKQQSAEKAEELLTEEEPHPVSGIRVFDLG